MYSTMSSQIQMAYTINFKIAWVCKNKWDIIFPIFIILQIQSTQNISR